MTWLTSNSPVFWLCALQTVILVASAKEVMLSLGVNYFVCLLAGLGTNCSTIFHKIRWKGGTWPTEESIRFCW